jgi:hypothetical protein
MRGFVGSVMRDFVGSVMRGFVGSVMRDFSWECNERFCWECNERFCWECNERFCWRRLWRNLKFKISSFLCLCLLFLSLSYFFLSLTFFQLFSCPFLCHSFHVLFLPFGRLYTSSYLYLNFILLNHSLLYHFFKTLSFPRLKLCCDAAWSSVLPGSVLRTLYSFRNWKPFLRSSKRFHCQVEKYGLACSVVPHTTS